MTVPGACPSCDIRARLIPDGVCVHCRDELRFVTRPAAHRETYRRRVAAQATLRQEWERRGVAVISSVPADNNLWICDLCNDRIPVDGDHTLFPLFGSYALCTRCVVRFPYWPDAWTQPAPRACRCACHQPLCALAPLRRIGRIVDEPRHDRGVEQ